MRVIVTGGAGLIGSHLCDALLKNGHEVISVDNLCKGSLENHTLAREFETFRFIKDDVCDEKLLKDYNEGADVVVHLAAFKIPRYGNRLDTLTVNSVGSYHVFELARRFNSKLVFASTSDVYGRNEKSPLTEEDALLFSGPEVARWSYAVSKLYEEHLGFAYAEKYDLPIVCMRFFATYGPRQHLSWWGGPTPVFIEKVYKKEPITIHGDGQQTRCCCYVADTVDGIVRCVEKPEANGHVFNIGTEREITILDYAKKIHELIYPGTEPQFEFIPYETFGKYEDIKRRVPCLKKTASLLGYQSKFTSEEGLEKTVAWQLAKYAAS